MFLLWELMSFIRDFDLYGQQQASTGVKIGEQDRYNYWYE